MADRPPHDLHVLLRHRPRSISLLSQPGGFEGGRSAFPAKHFNPNAVRVEDEERVVAGLVAILLGREMNVCAAGNAAGVRLVDLLTSVNLEGEVLDADAVVPVDATVGCTQAKTTITDFSAREVDDLLRSSVGRIPDLLGPSERSEQVEIEGERSLNIGDRKIDVMYSWRWQGCLSAPLSLPQPGRFQGLDEILTPLESRDHASAQSPGVGLLVDELPIASAPAYVPADSGDDSVPAVVELPKFVTGILPGFRKAAHCLRDLSGAATNARLDRVLGIDVFDVRGRQFEEPLGISINQPLVIDTPHDLDVLLRHRPRSISLLPQPGGFEGVRVGLRLSCCA
jgi:hypothetical protein